MGEIVMNERKWVEEKLWSFSLGKDPILTLGRLARYYHFVRKYSYKEIVQALREYLIRCDPHSNPDDWMDIIQSRAKNAGKYKLIDVNSVVVTQKELDLIATADGVRLQKLLFSLLCLAKFGNAVNPNNKNWVNHSCKDIFALANVAVPKNEQPYLINDLYRAGFLRFSHIIDNTNINVKIVDDDVEAESVIEIFDFHNLGNQYLRHLGGPYFECESCGMIIRKRSPRQTVCKQCAALPIL